MYRCVMKTTQARRMRLTGEATRLVRALATPSGMAMTAVLASMLREQAQRKGVPECPS